MTKQSSVGRGIAKVKELLDLLASVEELLASVDTETLALARKILSGLAAAAQTAAPPEIAANLPVSLIQEAQTPTQKSPAKPAVRRKPLGPTSAQLIPVQKTAQGPAAQPSPNPVPIKFQGRLTQAAYESVLQIKKIFTARDLIGHMENKGFKFSNNPQISIQVALKKMLVEGEQGVLEIVEQGGGRRPNIYRQRK